MVDTVNVDVLQDGPRSYVVRLQNVSDGTGESAVKKVDASTLVGPAGKTGLAPTYFAAESIQYDVQGFGYVQLLFDATTDDELATLSGQGYLEFDPAFNDPKSTGTTGDILLTTSGASNGSSYDITLKLRKKD
jgi:hypothetical protein